MSREQAFARSFLSLVPYIPIETYQYQIWETKFNYKIAERALNVLGIMSYS